MCFNMRGHDEAKYARQSYLIARSDLVTEAGDMILLI